MRLCLARLGEALITFLASSLAAARTSRSGYSRALYGHIRIAVEDSHDGFRFAEVAQVAEVTYVSWMNREVAGECKTGRMVGFVTSWWLFGYSGRQWVVRLS
jgi:hypothetical protein